MNGKKIKYNWYYMYSPDFTVTLKDGSVIHCNDKYFEYKGRSYYIDFSDDQSDKNRWGVGEHTVTASLLGVKSTFTVTITENPIKSVDIDTVEIIEGTNTSYTTDDNGKKYKSYNYSPAFTVTLKDGSVIPCEFGSFEYDGEVYYIDFSDDQSYRNQWGVGDHKAMATVMGFKSVFTVTITETPVMSIAVDDVETVENTNIYYIKDDNGKKYKRYAYSPIVTVFFKDGSVFISKDRCVEYNGETYYIDFTDDQAYNNRWGLGVHKATASLMGVESSFDINIIKTKIFGDADRDGEITVMDATLIQKHLVSLDAISSSRISVADVDSNGEITVVDATEIQKYLVGIKTYETIGKPCVI